MRFPIRRSTAAVGTLALAAVAAATVPRPAAPLDDAEIAHIAVTANQIDVDAARAVLPRLRTPDARSFAETMVRDHEAVIAKAVELAGKLGVVPADNDVSRQLIHDAADARERLAATPDRQVDRAYLEAEVGYHEAVIDAVEETLIPNTRNAELRALLEGVVPALRGHLERVRHLVESAR